MIEKNDPRLTDFVLGELGDADLALVAAAVEASSELQSVVAEIEHATQLLGNAFQEEPALGLEKSQRQVIERALNETNAARVGTPIVSRKSVGSSEVLDGGRRFRMMFVSAAAVMILLVGGTLYLNDWLAVGPRGGVASTENTRDGNGANDFEKKATKDESSLASDQNADGLLGGATPEDFVADSDVASEEGAVLNSFEKADRHVLPQPPQSNAGDGDTHDLKRFNALEIVDNRDRQAPMASAGLGGRPARGGGGLGAVDSDAGAVQAAAPMLTQGLRPDPAAKADLMLVESATAQNNSNGRTAARVFSESLEENAARAVIAKTQDLLSRSDLARLNLKVEARTQSMVQEIERPEMVYVPQKKISIKSDKGGAPNLSESLENKPRVIYRAQPTNVQFVRPVVVFSPKDADEIVERLAGRLDPKGSRVLKLEQLLGIEGELLGFRPEAEESPQVESDVASSNRDDGSQDLGSGTFSAGDGEVNQLDEIASRALLTEVRSQVGRRMRPQLEEDAPGFGEQRMAETFGGSKEVADRLYDRNDSQSVKSIERDGKAAVLDKSNLEEGDAIIGVAVHPMVPASLAEVDFTELIVELKAALDRRNHRIGK